MKDKISLPLQIHLPRKEHDKYKSFSALHYSVSDTQNNAKALCVYDQAEKFAHL